MSLARLALGLLCAWPVAADAWIAHRYDDQRVLFFFAEHGDHDPEPPAEKIAPAQAQYGNGGEMVRLTPVQFGSLKLHAMAISGQGPGRLDLHLHERLELRITGGTTAEVEIEDFVHQNTCSDHWIGALARVTRSADTYAVAKLKYYVVGTWKQPAVAWHDSSIRTANLDAAGKAQVEARLNALLHSELPKAESAIPDSKVEWKTIDRRLVNGEGTLTYDVQSVPLGRNGEFAWYVRALWKVSGRSAFLLAAWMDPGFRVTHVDSFTGRALRMPDFGGTQFDRTNLPKVLNVFDLDGSPCVLITAEGLESFAVDLEQYTPEGLKATGVTYGYGC